jgi:hypothetical protein
VTAAAAPLLVARSWPLERRALAAPVIEALWELIENTPWVTERYRDVTASGDHVGDTVVNSLSG